MLMNKEQMMVALNVAETAKDIDASALMTARFVLSCMDKIETLGEYNDTLHNVFYSADERKFYAYDDGEGNWAMCDTESLADGVVNDITDMYEYQYNDDNAKELRKLESQYQAAAKAHEEELKAKMAEKAAAEEQAPSVSVKELSPLETAFKEFCITFKAPALVARSSGLDVYIGNFKKIPSRFNTKCNIPGCDVYPKKGDDILYNFQTGCVCEHCAEKAEAYLAFVKKNAAAANEAAKEKKAANEATVARIKAMQEQRRQNMMNLMQQKPVASVASAVVYTDGGYRDGVYAWAYQIRYGNSVLEESGYGTDPAAAALRNVTGEMSAAMRGVLQAKKLGATKIELHYDYTGIEAWATGAWKAKNEFTQKYAAFMRNLGVEIVYTHVKGHTGVAGNERCDALCRQELNKGTAAKQAAAVNQ